MANGTVFNLPLHGVKIQEATEGVDILTDSFDANNYLQGFFRPPYKVLAEDTNISIPAASEGPGQIVMEYLNMDISTVNGLVFIAEFPTYIPPPGLMAELELILQITLYFGGTIFFDEQEPSVFDHHNRPKNVSGGGSIFVTTLPMNAFANAHFISVAEKGDIHVTINNDKTSEVITNLKILGLYEQPANQISVFDVDTGGGGGGEG
ncbi:hypothetical protein JCM12298_10510 [Desulfothermus naphthae]